MTIDLVSTHENLLVPVVIDNRADQKADAPIQPGVADEVRIDHQQEAQKNIAVVNIAAAVTEDDHADDSEENACNDRRNAE